MKTFHLYEIPRDSKIFGLECSDGSKFITFHRPDGMYSVCTTEKGHLCHLGVMTELVKVKGGYKLASE